jgi:hypothetical protein
VTVVVCNQLHTNSGLIGTTGVGNAVGSSLAMPNMDAKSKVNGGGTVRHPSAGVVYKIGQIRIRIETPRFKELGDLSPKTLVPAALLTGSVGQVVGLASREVRRAVGEVQLSRASARRGCTPGAAGYGPNRATSWSVQARWRPPYKACLPRSPRTAIPQLWAVHTTTLKLGRRGSSPEVAAPGPSKATSWSAQARLDPLIKAPPSRCRPTATLPSWAGLPTTQASVRRGSCPTGGPDTASPTTDMVAAGNPGGPFAPSSFQYQLSASFGSINYSISGLPNWLTASATSGTASTGTAVTFTVNANANTLATGTYGPTTITFTNSDTGYGTTTATATLSVNPPALLVTPATNIAASGTQGGPFTPPSFSYTLTAASGSVNYSPFQVRSATVQHRQHGGVNGRGKGRGQGL